MISTRLRVAAVTATSAGLAIAAFAGAASSIAATTPTPTSEILTAYTVHGTEKCARNPNDEPNAGPSFLGAEFTLNLPASYRPGESVVNPGIMGTSLSIKLTGTVAYYGPKGTLTPHSFRILNGGAVTMGLTGASQTTVSYIAKESPIAPVSLTDSGYSVQLAALQPEPTVTAPAGGTVGFSVSGFSIPIESFTSADGTGPSVKDTLNCSLLSSGPSLDVAKIPVAGDPVATPVPTPVITPAPTPTVTPEPTPTYDPLAPYVRDVYGAGYGYIGGFIVLTGDRFDGLTKLTVGGTQIKPLLQVGGLIIAFTPPKPPGAYPVNVYTKDHGINVGFPSPTFIYASLW